MNILPSNVKTRLRKTNVKVRSYQFKKISSISKMAILDEGIRYLSYVSLRDSSVLGKIYKANPISPVATGPEYPLEKPLPDGSFTKGYILYESMGMFSIDMPTFSLGKMITWFVNSELVISTPSLKNTLLTAGKFPPVNINKSLVLVQARIDDGINPLSNQNMYLQIKF